MALYPSWPASLTDAAWQKKKGSIAKIAGETGIGDAMKTAKTAFDRIDFNTMEPAQIHPSDRTVENLGAGKQAALAYHRSTIEPARVKIKAIRDLAEKTALDWKKNKLIPKSSTKAAEDVMSDANDLWQTLKSDSPGITEILKRWDEMAERLGQLEAIERKKIAEAIHNLKAALALTAKTPTKSAWTDDSKSPHQRCRSMCNAIKAIPGLKKHYWTTWQPYGDFFAKDVVPGTADEAQQIIGKIKIVGGSLKEFEATYEKFLDA